MTQAWSYEGGFHDLPCDDPRHHHCPESQGRELYDATIEKRAMFKQGERWCCVPEDAYYTFPITFCPFCGEKLVD